MYSVSRFLFNLARWKMGNSRILKMAAVARRDELTRQLEPTLGSRVLVGPFSGMRLNRASSWGADGDFMPKLLGTYEEDLHSVLERAIAAGPRTVVNVGCAEGYYSVGLALRLPSAKIYAFDLDSRAMAACALTARENSVSERVVVEGLCTTERLSQLASLPGHTFLVLDCEGAERALLDPSKVPGLIGCDILVETHGADIAELLSRNFRATHFIDRIFQGARNPNRVTALRELQEIDRWILVDEGRPVSMEWLACWAKA